MTGGMILAAVAFVVCGLVQIKIQTVNPAPTSPNALQTSVEFINVAPCERAVIQPNSFFKTNLSYAERSSSVFGSAGNTTLRVRMTNCFGQKNQFEEKIKVHLNATFQTVLLGLNKNKNITGSVVHRTFPEVDINTANSHVRLIYAPGDTDEAVDITLTHVMEKKKDVMFSNSSTDTTVATNTLLADEYGIKMVTFTNKTKINVQASQKKMKFGTFGTFTVVMMRHMKKENSEDGIYAKFFVDVESTSVHRIWQLPQYIVLTAAEVMFSVTGLEFAYSQAPSSMKSVLQACWLLTVAFGDLLVVIFSEVKPVKGVEKEMFLYGGLMAVISIVFAIMATFYTYLDFSGKEEPEEKALDDKAILGENGNGVTPASSTTTL